MVIPHVLYQVSNTKEVMQFVSVETGCSTSTLLTTCLPLCMTLVLTSYAIQHHSESSPVKDERSIALYNMLINHLSEEVNMHKLIWFLLNCNCIIKGDQLYTMLTVRSVDSSLVISLLGVPWWLFAYQWPQPHPSTL